jgi:hypothetical protein
MLIKGKEQPEEVTDETKEKKVKDKEVEGEIKKIVEQKEKEKEVILTPSLFDYNNNLLAEQIYKDGKFMFAVANYDSMKVNYKEEIESENYIYRPIPAKTLMDKKVVLFPTGVSEYGNTESLFKDVRSFIYKYWDAKKPSDYDLSTYYVLHSYLYDKFEEVPYLQNIGEWGAGKTRHLLTVGGLCYRAVNISGALTESGLFHLIDIFKGTVNIDEGDWSASDMWASVIKILNQGYCKGMSIVRMREGKDGKLFPVAYDPFSPKNIATRKLFKDEALDSRCIKIYAKEPEDLRSDIPLNLTEEFYTERQTLINKLLLWRLRKYPKVELDKTLQNTIKCSEPRLKQILIPVISSVDDPIARKNLIAYVLQREQELLENRKDTIEYIVFTVILDFAKKGIFPTVGEITEQLNLRLNNPKQEFTTQKIGVMLKRNPLNLQTTMDNDGYKRLYWTEEQLAKIGRKFGVETR